MIDTDVMQDASEIVHYDNPDIPLYIRTGILSDYPDMKALCHWHEDIELIYITEGEMNYHINGRSILMKEGDCIIVNSKQLHYGYSHFRHECKFICILFHPGLLNANPNIYKNYVTPFIENKNIEYFYYTECSENYHQVQELIKRILFLKKENGDAYELEAVSALYLLWRILFRQHRSILENENVYDISDLALQKKMVSYIYAHYQETLTLDEIAASGNISRSKCCIIFKRYLQQSPIDFANRYRLEVSRYLLANTQSSIAQIAVSCGFNHLSYFSRIFLREYGCTPTEYRKSTVK
ncbi:MAG: AraC family transcriptional regulator [Eubacteriales bacterium]|nr:AraC family transcriptional regulator [Eubacteriales bacterium]